MLGPEISRTVPCTGTPVSPVFEPAWHGCRSGMRCWTSSLTLRRLTAWA